ncbi:hypothetical protein [Actinomadura luteofluorescens]
MLTLAVSGMLVVGSALLVGAGVTFAVDDRRPAYRGRHRSTW